MVNKRCVRIFFIPDPHQRVPDDICNYLEDNKIVWPENDLPYIQSESGNSRLYFKSSEAIRYGFALNSEDAEKNIFYATGLLNTDEGIIEFCHRFDKEKYADKIDTTLEVLPNAD